MPKRAALLVLFAAACASTDGPAPAEPSADFGPAPSRRAAGAAPAAGDTSEAPSAGDLTEAVQPSLDDAEIAELRALGPAALDKLLMQYDGMMAGADRDALGATIDKVAAQRYATVSRLYWYTELDEAKQVAAAAGKPILSLRMLGRLDEDLSCANSRFFRVVLYANAELSRFLRERFILHWSSERAVPRLTIDYGDGRKLERTITGNSVHYVLDSAGHPIDALPGLYAPSVFRSELEDALELLGRLEGKSESERRSTVSEHHRVRLASRLDEWKAMGAIEVPLRGDSLIVPSAAEMGQLRTITKSMREMPSLKVVDLGTAPSELPDDPAAWAQIGLRLFPEAMPPKDTETANAAKPANAVPPERAPDDLQLAVVGAGYYPQRFRLATSPSPVKVPAILDDQSKALIRSMGPRRWSGTGLGSLEAIRLESAKPADEAALVIAAFEREVVGDTAKSEFDVRQGIRVLFINGYVQDLTTLNQQIYAQVFATPASDPWLGLAPSGFMALPHDGVIEAPAEAAR